jgi:hypothetical protein
MSHQNHLFLHWKIAFSLICALLVSLVGCQSNCSQVEINNYINEIVGLHTTFTELTNQALNHPELKANNIEQMKSMKDEFSQVDIPNCADDLAEKTLNAMQSSITYLAPTQDVFYLPYQLAKFALDDWQAVEDAVAELSTTQGE